VLELLSDSRCEHVDAGVGVGGRDGAPPLGLDDPVAFFIEHHNARQSEAVDALLRVSPGSKINGPVLDRGKDRWPIRKTWLAAS